jgi:outer membrane protein OmpA-like peptidoglycan-associated protein
MAVQRDIFAVKDSLIILWSGDAQAAKFLNAALNDERSRLEKLNQQTTEEQARMAEEQARLAAELAQKEKALAEKDSLLAKQKAEADKKLESLRSKTISVYKDARGTILSMSDILFETGKANLKEELKLNLAEIAAILKSLLSESKIEIEGHTDNVGSAATNQKLSEQRANAVMQYLVERGVDQKQLKAVGYGLTKPIADNKTKEGKAKNRRVELIIKD